MPPLDPDALDDDPIGSHAASATITVKGMLPRSCYVARYSRESVSRSARWGRRDIGVPPRAGEVELVGGVEDEPVVDALAAALVGEDERGAE